MLLSKLFFFLAFDEVFQVDELFVISGLRQYLHPSLASIWVIPYGVLFVLFAFKFVPFFFGASKPGGRFRFDCRWCLYYGSNSL